MTRDCPIWPHSPRILIVDDEPEAVALMRRILMSAGYDNPTSTFDPSHAPTLARTSSPDLVVLDLHMPRGGGLELLKTLRASGPIDARVPIVVVSGDLTVESRNAALELGANDFITKPFDRTELILRIRNMLKMRLLHLSLFDQKTALQRALAARECELEEGRLEMLERLALAAEVRDSETGRHMRSVGELSSAIAHKLGIGSKTAEVIRRAAPLHDIGKIGISDLTLLKPAGLADAEQEIMRSHTIIGARLLSGGNSPLLQTAATIALHHHEKWDGSGYPYMLSGAAIPVAARVVAVADVYDALRHDRPYRAAWSEKEAVALLIKGSGTHFDPQVIEAFLAIDELSLRSAA